MKTDIPYEIVRQEMQGKKGLVATIRSRFLPRPQEMVLKAQSEYKKKINNYDDIDLALKSLLEIEYDIFQKKQSELNKSFIEYADKMSLTQEFKNLNRIITSFKNRINKGEDPTSVLGGITNIIIALADSNRQSRVTRAGNSLMSHIAFLLEKNGFINKIHFQREFKVVNCKLDFFFPDIKTYTKEPKHCIAVACQTTSNDRFRLPIGQMPKNTINRACTAIGCDNFSKKLGAQSLTDDKLEESKSSGIKFVILENAMDTRIKKSETAMTYKDWFQELKSYNNSIWEIS